ncbi:MAG: hypothetical protein CW691_06280 [Candidatus Bathyarchaeum sp.]|nr:MAG: hypothetical protein CW691_06280 [Candidatus Bathyarchaeum sp.]
MHLMKLQNLSYNKGFILAFTIGFIVRLIPELLSFPYPIGWDTIYYAARINDGVVLTHWSDVFSTWLIYGILITLGNLTRLDPFLLLKIVAPLLYGGTTAGIFFVAWKKFNWAVTKSLLVSAFFALQLAALALSWHFYRNVFGAMILLFTIPFLRQDIGWKGTVGLSALSLLIVWGHEIAAVSLFAMVAGMFVLSVLRKETIPYKLFIAIIPAVIIFCGNIVFVSPYPNPMESNFLRLSDSVWAHPAGLFFLTDYLSVSTPIESYTSYFDLFSSVASLFILLYAFLVPLAVVGYFKDKSFNFWALLLAVGSFSCLILPFSALFLWGRWMLMLVYPLTFFAVNGLWKIKCGNAFDVSRFFSWFKAPKKMGIALSLISIVLGGLFMSWPLVDGKYGVIGWGNTFKYVPSTMQSSSVPICDTEGTVDAFEWLNTHMTNDSSLLVHDVFKFWTMLYLDQSYTAILFDNNLDEASKLAVQQGFESAYFVWWNQDIGWYNLQNSNDLVSVFDSGRISVFQVI